jgi:hypothetical protein
MAGGKKVLKLRAAKAVSIFVLSVYPQPQSIFFNIQIINSSSTAAVSS